MRAFFDTNVLVYCTDRQEPEKQRTALDLVTAFGTSGEGVISTQVLLELFHSLQRKQQLPASIAQGVVLAYGDWMTINSDRSLVHAAIDLSIRYKKSIFDAMVIEAALRSGAQTLYTENLQDGQKFEGLTVVNPFRLTGQ